MLKRKITSILTVFAMTLSILMPMNISAYAANPVNLSINGNPVQFSESSGLPFIDSANRTQVPFRASMDALGASVSWDDSSKTALATKDGITVSVPIGESYIVKNGVQIKNDTAAQIVNNITYLPIRAVFEAFGANVYWNQTAQTVMVSTYGNDFTSLQNDTQTHNAGNGSFEPVPTQPTTVQTAAPKKITPAPTPNLSITNSYVGNKNSKIFHRSNCSFVNRMSNRNKVPFNSRNVAVNSGYRPCKKCRP